MGKKLNRPLFYIFIGLLGFLLVETLLLFFYNPPPPSPKAKPFINNDSIWPLTFLKEGITEEATVYIKSKGKIIKIISDDTPPSDLPYIKIIVFGISSTSFQKYAFTEETLKVTSIFDKNNQPVTFSSLKTGDYIEISDTTNLIGDCPKDTCVKKVVIRVK